MRYICHSLMFLLLSITAINAQQPTPKPDPKPVSSPVQRTDIQRSVKNQTFSNQSGRRSGNSLDSLRVRFYARDYLQDLYRKPTSEELEVIKPDEEDLQKYASFLKEKNTGLIKLINDKGCSENTKIIVATSECLKYKFPGAGSSFSFRTENYRLRRLADITFTDNSFQATGAHLHGILVNIGDIPLEQINSNTNGMEVLVKFKPSTDYKNAAEVDKLLRNGLIHKGFIYRRALYMKENTTFILRSIAYRGKSFRAIRGMTYNELDFDKRRDVIVAFRVIRKYENGNISLIWREISNQKAPKLKR